MTSREVKKILAQVGWTFVSGGEHQTKAISPDGKIKVLIPEHGSKYIKIGTLKSIEKLTGINLRRKE